MSYHHDIEGAATGAKAYIQVLVPGKLESKQTSCEDSIERISQVQERQDNDNH